MTRHLFVFAFGLALLQTAPGASFSITSGTNGTARTLNAGETGSVSTGASLSISGGTTAITLGATTGTTTITNSGTIEQAGTGRTLRNNSSGTPTISITNNLNALIRSADADTIRADVAGSNWAVFNSGTIQSLNPSAGGSQAIDFDAVTTGTVSITNYANGQILAFAADAIRPGANATITNAGTITATLRSDDSAPSSDGIDTQMRSGVEVINTGSISGRHGITGGDAGLSTYGITVTNNADGIISGVNGSGINIDGVFATATASVTNALGATIQGGVAAGYSAGDGDGIDIDGVLTLDNYGNVYGYGAKGSGSDLLPNGAQAVSIGGGTIRNYATGQIIGSTLLADAPSGDVTRIGEGILVDDSSGGNAIAMASVNNDGLIRGKTGAAIRIIGNFADTVTNNATGTLRGAGSGAAVQTGGGGDIVTNRGAIIGDNGNAIDLQDGDDALIVEGGSASITGDISGGAGTNTFKLQLGAGNTFTYSVGTISNFASVEVKSGTTVLDGANRIAAASALELSGGQLKVFNAGGSNGQTFAALTLSDDSILNLDSSTSITFSSFAGYLPGKTLSILNYEVSVSPDWGIRFAGDVTSDASFMALMSATTVNGTAADYSYSGGFTNVVPEPSVLVALAGGVGLLLLQRRRRA